MFKKLSYWIPIAIVATCAFGTIYIVNQQSIRHAGDDPQIQLSQDMADKLNSGEDPFSVVPDASIDLSKSLATFTIIYDKDGQPLFSDAKLDNQPPIIPKGVLDFTKEKGEDRITWQPKTGVRLSVVVNYYKSDKGEGFVLVGRSLKEIEARQGILLIEVAGAWIATMILSLVAVLFLIRTPRVRES